MSNSDSEHKEFLDNNGYWGSKGVGAILYSPDEKKFILGLRSEGVLEPGTLGTFGGAIDSGESYDEALEREISEELSYDMPLESFELCTYTDSDSGFTYKNYLIVVDDIYFDPSLNWETEELVYLSLEEMMSSENLHYGVKSILDDQDAVNRLSHIERKRSFTFSYNEDSNKNKDNENSSLDF